MACQLIKRDKHESNIFMIQKQFTSNVPLNRGKFFLSKFANEAKIRKNGKTIKEKNFPQKIKNMKK
jgi:hypothetical protein